MILGCDGQLGSELIGSLENNKNLTLFPLSKDKKRNYKNFCGNLYFSNQVCAAIEAIKPKIIINCAAYTNVEKSEIRKRYCNRVNSTALKNISKTCKDLKILLIHFSTDFIFDGKTKYAYREIDKPNPINQYGLSKLIAEKNILDSNTYYIIFRISWVFSLNGNNFLNKIISKYLKREVLSIVGDQYGKPTSVNIIVKIINIVLKDIIINNNFHHKEIFNLACEGKTNWYLFAKEIVKYLNKIYGYNLIIKEIGSNQINGVKRPKNSVLNTYKIKKNYNLSLPSWKEELKDLLYNNLKT